MSDAQAMFHWRSGMILEIITYEKKVKEVGLKKTQERHKNS